MVDVEIIISINEKEIKLTINEIEALHDKLTTLLRKFPNPLIPYVAPNHPWMPSYDNPITKPSLTAQPSTINSPSTCGE